MLSTYPSVFVVCGEKGFLKSLQGGRVSQWDWSSRRCDLGEIRSVSGRLLMVVVVFDQWCRIINKKY